MDPPSNPGLRKLTMPAPFAGERLPSTSYPLAWTPSATRSPSRWTAGATASTPTSSSSPIDAIGGPYAARVPHWQIRPGFLPHDGLYDPSVHERLVLGAVSIRHVEERLCLFANVQQAPKRIEEVIHFRFTEAPAEHTRRTLVIFGRFKEQGCLGISRHHQVPVQSLVFPRRFVGHQAAFKKFDPAID